MVKNNGPRGAFAPLGWSSFGPLFAQKLRNLVDFLLLAGNCQVAQSYNCPLFQRFQNSPKLIRSPSLYPIELQALLIYNTTIILLLFFVNILVNIT